MVRALGEAPGAVRIEGFRISTCVRRARSDGQLQSVGLLLTAVADDLSTRARDTDDPRLALQLGFLAGAVQRGTGTDSGIAVELGRRIGRTTARLDRAPRPVRAALAEGIRAGTQRG